MVITKIPDKIKSIGRELRQKMTKAEKILWEELRNRKLGGKKFLRQYPIYVFSENNGFDRFVIPDFVSKEEKLIIELDGKIHDLIDIYLLDREKEKLLINNGYKIIRFTNKEITENIEGVLESLVKILKT